VICLVFLSGFRRPPVCPSIFRPPACHLIFVEFRSNWWNLTPKTAQKPASSKQARKSKAMASRIHTQESTRKAHKQSECGAKCTKSPTEATIRNSRKQPIDWADRLDARHGRMNGRAEIRGRSSNPPVDLLGSARRLPRLRSDQSNDRPIAANDHGESGGRTSSSSELELPAGMN
jgi:hypothetical protein